MSQRIQAPPFREHIFYSGIALAFILCVFVGFSRTYYLKGLFGTPHLSWLAHLHGAMFTAWTVFFLCQVALVAAGRTELHRRIGKAGAVLGVGVVMMGAVMTLHSMHAGYASGRPRMAALLINGFMNLFLFSVLFGAGLLFRRKKEIHKRLMVLAMLSLIIPAIARMPIPFYLIGWVIFAFSLTGVVYDVIVLRRVHLTSIMGVLLINVASPLRFIIADAPSWQRLSEWIAR
jgi:hypothetical protein